MNIIDKLFLFKKTMPDLQIKELENKVYVFNIQTVSNSSLTNEYILNYLSKRNLFKRRISLLNDLNKNIPSISFIKLEEKEVTDYLFNGFSVIIYKKEIIACETKASLDRGINEPTIEPTIKGPKDSFNENYNTNIGLIRKRIKDENLYIKEITLGNKTKTKIAVIYMNEVAEQELVNEVISKVSSIKTDKLLDTYYIKDLLRHENKTTFPTIKSTEKPDIIAKCLTEGKVCILSENSNNVLMAPTFFLDYFYYGEDNYQKHIFAFFIKVIRILALFITIFAPAIFLALITYDQQVLPTSLLINFASQRANLPFPALFEAFLLMFTFELLYEGDALTPVSRGTSLSVLGGLVLGESAVSAGIVSPIMVIVVAATAISSVFFVYYDFQSFIRLYRYSLMILASFFGIIGILFGFIIIVTNLCNIKSFGKPFLQPFSPILGIKSKKKLVKSGLMLQNYDKA